MHQEVEMQRIKNTIIAGSVGGVDCYIADGALETNGYNLIEDGTVFRYLRFPVSMFRLPDGKRRPDANPCAFGRQPGHQRRFQRLCENRYRH